jgi:hypothetical protein
MAAQTTPTADANGKGAATPPPAPSARSSEIALSFSLDEARVLRAVAQRGMLAAGSEGAPEGQPQQAKAALGKLVAALEAAEVAEYARRELEEAGLDTGRLSDAQVTSLARRLADGPRRPA